MLTDVADTQMVKEAGKANTDKDEGCAVEEALVARAAAQKRSLGLKYLEGCWVDNCECWCR